MMKDAKQDALRYMEHRDRSAFEVRKHLKDKEYCSEEIEEALDYLKDFHYIDDERYCERYIAYAGSKGRGSKRIKRELAEKGISQEVADSALDQYKEEVSEYENAMMQAEKLLRGELELSEKMKAKMARRLFSLGYSGTIVYDIIAKLSKKDFKKGY